MTTTSAHLFTIDQAYDRDKASDGISRFGAYLKQRYQQALDAGDLDSPTVWAEWCWDCATPPVMSPGFVRYRDPVLSAKVYRDEWQGELAVQLVVASPLPARLPSGWRSWHRDFAGDLELPDGARHGSPVALARVELEAILEVDVVVPDFRDQAELVDAATRTVVEVARSIERTCGEVVAAVGLLR